MHYGTTVPNGEVDAVKPLKNAFWDPDEENDPRVIFLGNSIYRTLNDSQQEREVTTKKSLTIFLLGDRDAL